MFIYCMGESRCTSRRVCLRRGSSWFVTPPFLLAGACGYLFKAALPPAPAPLCLTGFACCCQCELVGRRRGLGRLHVILTWLVGMWVGSSDKRCPPEDDSGDAVLERSFRCLMSFCCFLLDWSQCFSYIGISRCFLEPTFRTIFLLACFLSVFFCLFFFASVPVPIILVILIVVFWKGRSVVVGRSPEGAYPEGA